MARSAHQQRGHGHQQRRRGQAPPARSAHGCGSTGSRRIRARGAGPRGSCSEVAAWQVLGPYVLLFHARSSRAAAPAGRGSPIRPGRGARPPPLQTRRRGSDPRSRGPEPRAAPQTSRLSALSALGRDLRTLGQTDARTEGRADGRVGTWAGGWRAGGGSKGCSARKQRGPSAGPRADRGKSRCGLQLGRDSAPERGLGGVDGGRTERGAAPPRPARRTAGLPLSGPALQAPVVL